MEIELDTDELVQAIMDDDSAIDSLTESLGELMSQRISDATRDEVRESFDYHHDQFRMSWMRMMESEANDLEHSTRASACEHGQKMFRAFDSASRAYLREHTAEAKSILGIGDDLLTTLTELVNAAVEAAVTAKINSVWAGSGYTVDARSHKAAFSRWVADDSPAGGHLANYDEFGNPLVSSYHNE